MLKSVIYSNEITVWWKRETFEKINYKIFVNDKFLGDTCSTFYTIKNLKPNTQYKIKVQFISAANEILQEYVTVCKTNIEKRIVNVTQLDGFTKNGLLTTVIQKALDDLKSDEVLYFPNGTYLSGALNVHSNSEIYLEKGAILKGSERVLDYEPKIHSRFEGVERECYASLLNLGTLNSEGDFSCENVIIHGEGAIIGGGKKLQDSTIEQEKFLLEKENSDYCKIKEVESPNTIPGRARGRLINISNSKNIIISGLTLGYGASWNIHMIYSENIVTEGCRIESVGVWNGDGWDPDSSKDCAIFNCVFYTHDDCVAIKSGKNPEGNIINRPSENIYIFSCKSEIGNGIAIGSEMSGGIANIYLWDCDFTRSGRGFEIKTSKKRGGYIKNVNIIDCKFPSILIGEVTNYNNDGEAALTLPIIEDINICKVQLTGKSVYIDRELEKYAIQIEDHGIVGKIRRVKIEDIEIAKKSKELSESIFIDIKEQYKLNNVKFI